jgi:metal-responsive CopG/Arc/MetJ family transcriptional regulator
MRATVSLSAPVYEAATKTAQELGVTRSQLIARALEVFTQQQQAENRANAARFEAKRKAEAKRKKDAEITASLNCFLNDPANAGAVAEYNAITKWNNHRCMREALKDDVW